MRRQGQSRASRRGGALLEAALCTPILLYLLVAVGDFGRFYVESARLNDTAAAAAHRAAGGGEAPDETGDGRPTIRVETFCGCPSDPDQRFACGERLCGDYGEPARYVEASVEEPFSFIARYPGFPRTFTLKRTAGVRTR